MTQHVEAIEAAGEWSGDPLDSVVLDYEDRFRRRIVLTGIKGTSILLELPQPELLKDGDGLRLRSGEIVRVEAAAEKLAVIRCDTPLQLTKIAWHLGNRHLPAEIHSDRIHIRYDHVIVDMVEKLGAQISRIEAPFQPESGAYSGSSHHGHD